MISPGMRAYFNRFGRDRRGGVPMQMALIFGAGGIVAALFLAPFLQNATQRYAANDNFGIDRTITGSVHQPGRYIIRQSVLSPKPEFICDGGPPSSCGPRR